VLSLNQESIIAASRFLFGGMPSDDDILEFLLAADAGQRGTSERQRAIFFRYES
jgi:hypothetical protein